MGPGRPCEAWLRHDAGMTEVGVELACLLSTSSRRRAGSTQDSAHAFGARCSKVEALSSYFRPMLQESSAQSVSTTLPMASRRSSTPMASADLFQRIGGVDARVQLARRDPIEHLAHVGAMALRVALDGFAPEHADRRRAFDEQQVERDFRDVARGKADDQEAALPGERAYGGLRRVAADAVVDDIDTVSARERAQAALQSVCRIVRALVGAVRPCRRRAFPPRKQRRSRARPSAWRSPPRRARPRPPRPAPPPSRPP